MNIETNHKEHNLPNGLPTQFNKPNMLTSVQYNGISSSQSSRTSSPANRLANIPASQLPPTQPFIPNANVNQLTQNYSHLNITPNVSPSKQNFNTSTPVTQTQDSSIQNIQANISPIITTEATRFTHSTQSSFTNVVPNTQTLHAPVATIVPLNPASRSNLPSLNTNTSNSMHSVATFPQGPPSNINMPVQFQQVQQHVHQIPQQPFKPTQIQNYNSMPNVNQNKIARPPFPAGIVNAVQVPSSTNSLPPNNVQHSNFNIQKQPQLLNNNTVPSLTPGLAHQIPPTTAGLTPHQIPPLAAGFTPHQIPPGLTPQQIPPLTSGPPPPFISNPPPPTSTLKTNLHSSRYPTASHYSNVPIEPPQNNQVPQQYIYSNQNQQQRNYGNSNNHYQHHNTSNIVNSGFSKAWGHESYDLLQCTNILPAGKVDSPRINLGQTLSDASNCSPDIFRCTMTKIPDTNSLLQKSRLPLGVLIHPFKDLDHLPVIQCSTIVRCRACRTYINPFVYFVDTKRWKCNLCYRVNELPEEFQFDPVSKTYGDPSRRPEVKSSTIEYIAPSEYMLRPPQPAVYIFLLDVSHAAIESGYLHIFCDVLRTSLSNLPGDARTQLGFIAYNSALHFYSLAEGLTQPHEMTVLEIEDIFLPCPDNLVVNLQERSELISDLLAQLPTRFNSSFDTGSALGAALQAAYKMISSTGGRITVFQSALPTSGPGSLTAREDPSQRAGADVQHLNPANDFYKRLALDCSGQQIAVDLFIVNSQYVDIATLSGISRFSGGSIHHFPLFKAGHTLHAEKLERCFKRYLTRKIGFEAVMRIRCTRGLAIHTFHGNFFVRSTDLLSLPNINPEAGFGMQVAIEESLSDISNVCFQAALLYTSSKGERRIRVHTLCVPIATTLTDIINSADQQCIIGLLAKMAVDRSMMSSLSDAREAFINVAIDTLSSYKLSLNLGSPPTGLLAPGCLRLLPLYISALLKYVAFRTGMSTRLDDRVKAMCDMKTLPLYLLMQYVYPDLYPVHNLDEQNTTLSIEGEAVPQPPHLQLSARCLDSKGAFLMDIGDQMVLFVCPSVSQTFLQETLGVPDYNTISEEMYELPVLSNPHNQRLHNFINSLNDEKPYTSSLHIIRDNSPNRNIFIERLIEDRVENALSYHEFLQHLKTQVK